MEHVRLDTIPCSEGVSDGAEATSFSLSSGTDILCPVSKQMGGLPLDHSEGCPYREDRGPQAADPELRTGRPTRAPMSEPRASGYHHLSWAAMPDSLLLTDAVLSTKE